MLAVANATGKVSHARQVKGDDPDKEGYPGPPGWGLDVRLTSPPHKKVYCYETSRKLIRMDISAMTRGNMQRSAAKDTEQIGIKDWHLECSLVV